MRFVPLNMPPPPPPLPPPSSPPPPLPTDAAPAARDAAAAVSNGRGKRPQEQASTKKEKKVKLDANPAAPIAVVAAVPANSDEEEDADNDDNDDNDADDNNNYLEEQASQAMFDEDDQEWEKGAVKDYVETEVPKTLAEMSWQLKNGSIEVGLHETNRDHVFHLVNNKLGKPILLFPQGMAKLLTECLPKAYEIYDANEKDVENINDGIIFSETLILSRYVKNVVEVSVYKKQIYIFLKRLGKPDAMKKTSAYTGAVKPYSGPKLEPDEDGFIPMKSCSIQFDRETDDPAKILVWARKCITIPY
jgi:hypothetical protein